VVDSLGLEQFDLLGMSHGGSVSIAYAVRHPRRVKHLILYGAFARGWTKMGLSAEKLEELKAVETLMRSGWGRDNPAFRQIFTSWFMPDATAEQMRAFNEYQKVSASPENAVKLYKVIGDTDVSGLLSKVSVPTIVFHARRDGLVPFRDGLQLAALIPGARFVPLESMNHVLLEDETAWKNFLLEYRRFLGVPEEVAETDDIKETAKRSAKNDPTEEVFLVYIDILGFDELPKEIGRLHSVEVGEVRKSIVDNVNQRLLQIKESGLTVRHLYGVNLDGWLLFCRSLPNAVQSVREITKTRLPYQKAKRLLFEIVIDLLQTKVDLVQDWQVYGNGTIAFLKSNIVGFYHRKYRERFGSSPTATYALITETANAANKSEPVEKEKFECGNIRFYKLREVFGEQNKTNGINS
jgi:hypothetical protein